MKLDDISIRTTFKPGDIGYITFMHGQFYQFGPLFEVYVAETLADFYKTLNPSNERVWIAEYDDRIIGTLALKNTNGFAQLRYFLLDPKYRRMGLGKRMMRLFMDFMKACGYTRSFLLTEGQLQAAAHLYQSYGYRLVHERANEIGLIEQRYELEL